jgi:hypothetical protein
LKLHDVVFLVASPCCYVIWYVGTNIPEENIASVFSFEGLNSRAEMLVCLSRTTLRSHDPEYCGKNAHGTLKGCHCDDQAGNGRIMKTVFFVENGREANRFEYSNLFSQ